MRFAALRMVDFTVKHAVSGKLRIDALTWDTQDSRHSIHGRDDLRNLERMYYHLFKNVFNKRWPKGCVWRLRPDEHSALDWDSLASFVRGAGVSTTVLTDFLGESLVVLFNNQYQIYDLVPSSSARLVLIQLADLFAGIAVYSRQEYACYTEWQYTVNGRQMSLFDEDQNSPLDLNKSDVERCRVLHELNTKCKAYSLGVSLRTYNGLRTMSPDGPINFWWYEPQHELDKAPIKGRS